MRILHIAKIIQIAGAEQHLLNLLPGLRTAGIDARMLVLEKSGTPAVERFVEQLRQSGVPTDVIPAPPSQSLLNQAVPSLLSQMRAVIAEQKPDIVHTHLIHGDIYGTLAARLAGVSHRVSSRHNLDPFRRRRKWQIVSWLMWHSYSGGIAISDAVRDFVVNVEHAPPHKIQTINYGISPPRTIDPEQRAEVRRMWGIGADVPVVGSVSRLIKQKGLQYGIEAFARVRQHIPNTHYVIAGDGELRITLEDQASELGLSDFIHFLGWQDDVHRVFSAIDVLLSPSLWEGFGVVFLEAMGHRLPIITTDVPPMTEVIVNRTTGYTVEPANSEALIEPLRTLLTDSDLRRRMGEAGRLRLESVFAVDTMVRQTVEFYERILR